MCENVRIFLILNGASNTRPCGMVGDQIRPPIKHTEETLDGVEKRTEIPKITNNNSKALVNVSTTAFSYGLMLRRESTIVA